jgi:pimeloyl-ACP methyl ester carboxylesterase
MNGNPPVSTDHRLLQGVFCDNTLDSDWNGADETHGDCVNEINLRPYNDQQQVNLSHRKPNVVGLQNGCIPSNGVSRKFKYTKSSKPPTFMPFLLLIMMITFDSKSFHARGFSSSAVKCKRTRMRKMYSEGLQIRKEQYQNIRQHRQSSVTANSASLFLSRSPAINQEEATISLEWMEYFSPTTEADEKCEQTQQIPVLFLHGLLGNKRNFATCAKMLAVQLDKKRRIMGLDLRNHGDTKPWSDESKWKECCGRLQCWHFSIGFMLNNRYFLILNVLFCSKVSYPSMAQDVVNFLKSQNIKKIILVGHSMGGKVAQALALLYPEYVEGLVVLDIAPVTYSREKDPHWKAVEDILRAVHRVIEESAATGEVATKRDVDLSLRKPIPDPALRAFVLTNFDSRNNEWKIPIATMVQELEQIAGFDLTATSTTASSSSSTYEGDVFIINGGQSRFVRHSYMDQIASYFPNHMLTTIRGSGHWVHAEAPDDLVALLKRYLDR